MKWRSLVLASLAAGALAIPASANAALITGSFSISGAFTYDTMGGPCGITGCNLAGLDFDQVLPPPTAPTGPFIQVTSATGYFAGLGMTAFVTTGDILNITNNPAPPLNYTYAQDGVAITVPNFLQGFNNCGGLCNALHFDLNFIPDQPGPGCPSLPACAEGPFLLTQTALGIRVDFDVIGKFVNGGDSNDYIGSFSTTFNGLTMAEVGNRIGPGGNGLDIACGPTNSEQTCSFTANFNPANIPEPATMLTFGAGSLVLARLRRRKKN
jgi:hypothetical protein